MALAVTPGNGEHCLQAGAFPDQALRFLLSDLPPLSVQVPARSPPAHPDHDSRFALPLLGIEPAIARHQLDLIDRWQCENTEQWQ
ncbi:MAG: hypothetical protein GX093_11940 [Xanthomonadaceae bacterium]|nr:hypothetical protein [Xanthomonadaceae bacterium]